MYFMRIQKIEQMAIVRTKTEKKKEEKKKIAHCTRCIFHRFILKK